MQHSKFIQTILLSSFLAITAAADPVVVFTPMQMEENTVDGVFNDIVAAELSCSEKIKLVDRELLGKILREKSLAPGGLLNAEDAGSVGSLLGADYFISGSVRKKEGNLLIFIRSVSVRTGSVKMKYLHSSADLESAAKKTAQTGVELVTEQTEKKTPPQSGNPPLLFPEKTRPAVAVCIPEIHVASQRLIDPAAENEITKVLLQQNFTVRQISAQLKLGENGLWDNLAGSRTTWLKAAEKAGAAFLIYGEGISESSDMFGNYRTARARLEIKVISVSDGRIVFADSACAGAADAAEVIAGKKAILKAASGLALKVAGALLEKTEVR